MNDLNLRLLTASLAALATFTAVPVAAQTSWTGTTDGISWEVAGNWSAGIPTSTSDTTINVQPTSNVIGVDNGGNGIAAKSITFGTALTAGINISPIGLDTLSVPANITNLSNFLQTFSLPVVDTGAAAVTYAGGPGGLAFTDGLSLGVNNINTTGTVTVTGALVFTINSTAAGPGTITFGQIGNITTNAGTNVGVVGTYTNNATLAADTGDFFKLSTGNLTGANASSIPTFVDAGLTFVTTLIQKGILFVEPSAGGTQINAGVVLPIDNDSQFNPNGVITSITLNGGELLTDTSFSTDRTVTVNSTGGKIAATNGTTLTLSALAIISGSGALTIGDAANPTGTVVIGAVNTHTGTTTVTAGTLQLNGSLATGDALTLSSGTTLTGTNGTVGGTTTMNSAAINGTNLTLTGATTVNGAGNTIAGTETSTGGVTVASGAALTQTGTLTGNLATTGTTTLNGALTGNATVNSGGTLTGTGGSVSGTTTVTSGTVSGTGQTLTGLVTFNGAGNTLSGTETATAGVTVATGAALTQSGTVTGNLTTSGTTTVNGTFTGTATVISGTLTGTNGTIGGATTVTSGTVSGTNQTLTGLVTFNGAGNTLSGTETASAGVTVAAGAALTQSGTVTGNLATTGTTTLNGTLAGNATVNSGGTLTGTAGHVTGTTSVTSGTISGTGQTLTGLITFNGAGNTLAGTETAAGGATVATGATVTQSGGTFTGNLTNVAGTFTANGTVTGSVGLSNGGALAGVGTTGAVTLVGNNNLSSTGTLHTGAITVGGAGNTISGGTVNGNTTINNGGVLTVAAGATDSGSVSISTGGTLSGAGTVGALTLANNANINLQDGAFATLTGSSLSVPAGTGNLSIDIGATAGQTDLLHLTGAATLSNGSVLVNVAGTGAISSGTQYTIANAASGLTVNDFTAGSLTGSLSGDTVAFSLGANDSIIMTVTVLNGYYYTGANSSDIATAGNFNTAASGGTPQTLAPSSTTDVFISATSPAPTTNPNPSVTGAVTLNSVNFTAAGSGASITGAGTLTVNAGINVQNNVAGTETITAAVALGANQTWTVGTGGTLDDQAGISGAHSLNKAGTGTLILSGANTYTGATSVSAGALQASNANSLAGTSGITVMGGAALQLTGGQNFNFASGAVTTSLTGTGIGGNGALENVSSNNTYSSLVSLGGDTIIGSDAGTLTLSNAGTITGAGDNLTLTSTVNGSVVVDSIIGTGTGGVTKTGAGTATLAGVNTYTGATTVAGGTLFIGAGGSVATSSGVNITASGAIFDITTAGNQTIKDLAGVTGSVVNIGANTLTEGTNNSTTFAGSIEGTGGGLTKVGTGTLTLSGANTYTGATTVNGGGLQVNGSLAAGSAVTLATGTTLSGSGTVGGTTTSNGAAIAGTGLTLTGLVTENGTGNTISGTETASGGVTVAAAAAVTQTGTLTGNLTDAGTATLNGALVGNTTVTSGGILAGSGSVSGTTGVTSGTINGTGLTLTGATTFNGAGNTLSGTETAAGGVVVATGAAVTQTGTVTGNLSTTGTTTLNGTLAGNATVNSGGTLTGTAGHVTGTTTVTSGTVSGTGQTLTGLVTFNGAGNTLSGTETATAGVTVATGADVTQTGTLTGNLSTTGTTTLNGILAGNATVNSGGTLTGTGGTVNGTTSVTSGTVSGTGQTLTGLVTFNGAGNTLSGTETAAGGVVVATGAAVTQTGTLTGNLSTTGTTTLNGTLAGNATVNSGGTLTGTGGTVTGTTTVTSGTVSGTGQTLTGLVTFTGAGNTLSGTETATAGVAITGAGAVAQSGTLTGNVTDTSSAASTFAGSIAGASTVIENGTGSLTLSGANSYTGGTTLTSGTLNVTGAGTLGTGAPLTATGGTLDLGGTTQTTGNVLINGPTTIQNGTLSTSNFVDTTAAGTATISANLNLGGAGITKNGAGTLVLSGNNTVGGTSLQAGTLVVASAGALGAGSVTQTGTSTLTTLNPAGTTTINIGGNYSIATGSTLALHLSATTTDFVSVAGMATLDGSLSLTFSSAPVKGQMFTVLSAAGGIQGAPSAGFTMPTVSPAGFVVTAAEAVNGDDFVVTIVSTQLGLTSVLGSGFSNNRAAVLNYIDMNAVGGPLFNAISTALNGQSVAGAQAVAVDVADQMNPAKFANFVRSAAFNDAVFTTQMQDSLFESQRSTDGFLATDGKLNYSNLNVAGSGADAGLSAISGRLLAWAPTPLAHGMLSDTPVPVLGGVDMKDTKMTTTTTGPDHRFNTFIMGNVVLAQNYSQTDLAHADETSGQVQIGGDYRITPHLRAGGLFGYTHTDGTLDDNNSKATIDAYAPGVFATFADKGWYANAIGMYGFNSYTEDRRLAIGGVNTTAHGAPDGNTITGDLDGGYDFNMAGFTFGPLAGVQYTHLTVNGFDESGADALGANEHIFKSETDSLRSRLGAHVSYPYHVGTITLTPHLDASWQHEFLDGGQGIDGQIITLGGGPFTVRTPSPSRDSALIDAGLNADVTGQVTVFGDYSVQAGQSNYFGQSVQAGVKIGF